MRAPKISVLMPSYNVAKYIRECIESVVSQTLSEIEILCIDAGSTDGTLEIIREFEKNDDRISVVCSEKKSYGYQMNLGIRLAKGEYIGIVETDDYIDRNMFGVLWNAACTHHADVIKGLPYERYEYDGGYSIELLGDYLLSDKKTGILISPDKDPSVHVWDGNIWNGIYRREFLNDHNIAFNETNGAAFQDIGFFQTVLNEADSVFYLRNHIYHYRVVRPGSSTWNPFCLQFTYQEYRVLLGEKRIKKTHLPFFYERMALSFLYEIEKAFCYAGFDEKSLECPEAIDWFAEVMRGALAENQISTGRMKEGRGLALLSFLADRNAFRLRLKWEMLALSKWVEQIRKMIEQHALVIYGGDECGMMVLLFLLRNGICPVAIADNDAWRRNTTIYGIPFLYLDEAVVRYTDAVFLICNSLEADESKRQLIERGVDLDRISIFNDKDIDLVNGMRRMPILPKNGLG